MKLSKILTEFLVCILSITFVVPITNTTIRAQEIKNLNNQPPTPQQVLSKGTQVETEEELQVLADSVNQYAVTFVISEKGSLTRSNEEILSKTEITYFIPKVETRSSQNIDEAILAGSFYLYGTINYLKSGTNAKLLSGSGGYRRGDWAFSIVSQSITYGMASGAYNYTGSKNLGKNSTFSFTCPSSWPYVSLNASPRSFGYTHRMTATHGTATYTSDVHNEI